jgi:hypothetical protein
VSQLVTRTPLRLATVHINEHAVHKKAERGASDDSSIPETPNEQERIRRKLVEHELLGYESDDSDG